MSIRSFVECDVTNPAGVRCEKKQEVKGPGLLPPGWATVTRMRPPQIEDVKMMQALSPMLEYSRKKMNENEKDIAGDLVDQMSANMLENMHPVAVRSHICPTCAEAIPSAKGSAGDVYDCPIEVG